MGTVQDVSEAIEIIAKISTRYNWIPTRVTHIAKEAYSIAFFEYDGEYGREDAIRAISTIQRRANREGWKHDPLILVFPMGAYRLNIGIPSWRNCRKRRITRILSIPVRTYSRADYAIVKTLEEEIRGYEELISNTVQETLAAYAWFLARRPDYVARNVEITVPTPYPDPIRTKIRARRDYGITVVEMDALGVKGDGIIVMEAKAASGGRRHWENIVRRKIGTYKAIPHYLGRNTTADFVITSNSGVLAEQYAQRTADETRYSKPFERGVVLAAWARRVVKWKKIR